MKLAVLIADRVIGRSCAAGDDVVVALWAGAGGGCGDLWLGAQIRSAFAVHKAQISGTQQRHSLALRHARIVGADGQAGWRDVASCTHQIHGVIVASIAINQRVTRVRIQGARSRASRIKALREIADAVAR